MVVRRLSGEVPCYWLVCGFLSPCVVEGISWGVSSFGIIYFMFPLDLGFENTSKCLGGVFAAK